jgi:flagellar export protein FliJ
MEVSGLRARLATLESSVASTALPATAGVGELVAQRSALAGAAVLIGETRDAVATAEVVSAEARARWAADRSRLAAVEHLLERRAARRRTEAGRREAREADDLAAQRWQRGAR